jgi:two-component system LytT family response regulator
MIRSVVLDNTPQSREDLSKIIEENFTNVKVIGTAGSTDVLTLLQAEKPDLVFIDAEMPSGISSELLDTIRQLNFDIIFTTRNMTETEQEQYAMAIKAIKYSALDYVNQPYQVEELRTAIKKVEEKRSHNETGNENDLIYFDNEQL